MSRLQTVSDHRLSASSPILATAARAPHRSVVAQHRLATALLACLLPAASAQAAFTYAGTVQGTVSAVQATPDLNNPGLTGVAVGDPVSVEFSLISPPNPAMTGSLGALSYQIGNYTWTTPLTPIAPNTGLLSAAVSQSRFYLSTNADIYGATGPFFTGVSGTFSFELLAAASQSLFPGQDPASAPLDPFAGAGFNPAALASATGSIYGGDLLRVPYTIQFAINSVTFIPEPSAIAFAALASRLMARRKR